MWTGRPPLENSQLARGTPNGAFGRWLLVFGRLSISGPSIVEINRQKLTDDLNNAPHSPEVVEDPNHPRTMPAQK